VTAEELAFLFQAAAYYRTKGSLIMKKLLLALLLTLAVTSPSFADALDHTTCPGSGCQVTNTHGKGSISIQIVGTFSGTLTFEQSNDGGTTYVTLSVTPYNSSTAVTTTTAAGLWTANLAGVDKVRVRFSSYSSGTANVYIGTTVASLGSGGGGLTSVAEANLSFTDVTTANATSSLHGLLPKLSGNAYDFFLGDGTYGRTVARGTLTSATSPWTFTQTWNNAAVSFQGLVVNITNTAALTSSRSFSVQSAGVDVFSVRSDGFTSAGFLSVGATSTLSGDVQVGNGSHLGFSDGSDYGAAIMRVSGGSGGLKVANASTGYQEMQAQDFKLVPNGVSQPSCVSGIRGTIWYTSSAGGAADKIEICAKAAADTYAWRSMATIP
jgi:hypothetical protein